MEFLEIPMKPQEFSKHFNPFLGFDGEKYEGNEGYKGDERYKGTVLMQSVSV